MASSQHNPSILEALETLRLGHDELSDPELSHLARAMEEDPQLGDRLARIERTDEQIASVMHDVVVPNGLEQQLLSRLAPGAGDAVVQEATVLETPGQETRIDERTIATQPQLSRRLATSRLFWGSSIAVAASVVLASWSVARSFDSVLQQRPIWPRHIGRRRASACGVCGQRRRESCGQQSMAQNRRFSWLTGRCLRSDRSAR